MEPKETILYIPIDFVGNDETAFRFENIYLRSLLEANQKISDLKLPLKLSLKTTLIQKDKHGWGVTHKGEESFNHTITKLGREGIDYFVEYWSSGPTRSMYGVLFDSGAISRGFKAICTGDLDQFPPQENVEKFIELYERVAKHNHFLGVGSRNTPIVLSYNQENAYLRRIFEATMNLAAQYQGNTSLDLEGMVDQTYKDHGDMITGVYLFRPRGQNSDLFKEDLLRTARSNDFFGFEGEYYMVISAAVKYNGITGIVFNSINNPFPKIEPKEERQKIIEKQIKLPLKKIS